MGAVAPKTNKKPNRLYKTPRCVGHISWSPSRSYKSYIDDLDGDNPVLITLYFINVYILQIIYDKLPCMLYTSTKSVTS
jgi:hypothetical protein